MICNIKEVFFEQEMENKGIEKVTSLPKRPGVFILKKKSKKDWRYVACKVKDKYTIRFAYNPKAKQ